jgi:pyridinium-3,5-biscarboxylic acid mononucleotide synthase
LGNDSLSPIYLCFRYKLAVDCYNAIFKSVSNFSRIIMNKDSLKKLLEELYHQKIGPEEVLEALRELPYEDLGFVQIDHHRDLRKGFPEVIYCPGKTTDQICQIVERMLAVGSTILATRANLDVYEHIKKIDTRAHYNSLARTIVIEQDSQRKNTQGQVLVVTAGTADIPVAEEALVTAHTLGSTVKKLYDVGVAGIHRLLDKKLLLSEARVIVVVAGMDGALASVLGGLIDKPIIAVPTSVGYGANFYGLASLLTMLNTCATGVATVNIDNGFGAGYLAHKINILGEHDE